MTEKEYFEKLGIGNKSPRCNSCCQNKCCQNRCCKDKELTCCDEDKLEKLLELSIEQRKFAIEHYWNRANYFWLFVAAFFVAYVETLPDKGGCCGNSSDFQMGLVNLLVCIGGLFSSICWYVANRGSKYWQENWELHINTISKKLGKPIFQILMNPKTCIFNPFTYYPYSFTRVNLLLNLGIIGIWTLLLLQHFDVVVDVWHFSMSNPLFVLLLVILMWIIMHFCTINFVKRRKICKIKDFCPIFKCFKCKKEEEEPFIFIDDNP